jgi:peptidyl-prolyl cis-trans isomerase SurA
VIRAASSALSIALCLALSAGAARAAEQLVDGIAAQVGSKIVLVSEVMEMVAPMEAELRQRGATDGDLAAIRSEALERMIEWRLLEGVVAQAELAASDADVDQAIDAIAKENGRTREELIANVEAHGLPLADYRAQLRREIERSRVVAAVVGPKIRVEEDAVRRLFDERYGKQPTGGDQVHLRQVLVPFGEGSGRDKAQACETVEGAARRVAAGERFEEVAAQTSSVAPERGGDLGWIATGELAGWMSEVVAGLAPGQVSQVVELEGACSLLQLVDRQAYAPVTYETARPMLEREIRGMLEVQEYQAWLDKLRNNTYIERRGVFAAAAPTGPGAR